MHRFVLAAAMCAISARCQVQAKFTISKTTFSSGEPIVLEYTIRNTGTAPVSVYAASPNSFCSGYQVDVERTDAVTEKKGCGGLSGGSCLSSSAILKPGEQRVEHYLVNYDHDLKTPGHYRISARRSLATSPEASLSSLQLGPQVNASGEFEIEIAEPDEAVLRRSLLPYFADLKSDDWQRRNFATSIVERLSAPAVEDVVFEMKNDPIMPYLQVRALAAVNTERTRKRLAEIASGPGDRRYDAGDALGKSGDRTYWPLLQKLAAAEPGDKADVFTSGAARLGGDDAVVWIAELLRSRAISRSNAIWPLEQTASRRAVPILIDMMSDPNPNVQTSAQSALVNLTHHTYNPRQIVPEDTPAAHAAWLHWWSHNGDSTPIYKFGEYCGDAQPLN